MILSQHCYSRSLTLSQHTLTHSRSVMERRQQCAAPTLPTEGFDQRHAAVGP